MEIAEVQIVLADSQLDLVGVKREPQYVGGYKTGNTLVNSLSHLCGVYGNYSRLLLCDSAGRLEVGGAYMVSFGAALGTIQNALLSTNVAVSEILDILSDVWVPASHALRNIPAT